jgi:hypothetical protein
MDRSSSSAVEHYRAMCIGGGIPLGALLCASGGDGREFGIYASSGRAIYANALLRCSKDALVACQEGVRNQYQAGTATFAANGAGSYLCQAALVHSGSGTSNLSLSVERVAYCTPQSSVGDGHHLHPNAAWFRIPGSHYGLVQPVRYFLGVVGDAGHEFLHNGFGMGLAEGETGNIQFGSGSTIHKRAVYGAASVPERPNQHGWTGTCDGQHLCRTSLADGEIRRGVSEGLPGCAGSCRKPSGLFSILQLRTSPSILGISDSGRDIFPEATSKRNPWKSGHGSDRVAMRSLNVSQYRRVFSQKTGQAKNFGK